MNFYLSAVDDQLRHPDDQPSIGIILCQDRDQVIVEYALRDSSKPMGVAQYQVSPALPDQLKASLPTREDFAQEMPAMAVVRLRIEIERALRDFAAHHGLPVERTQGLRHVLQALQQQGVAPPSTDQFLQALRVMNDAAHGINVEAADTTEALRIGAQFLSELSTPGDAPG